MKRKSEDICSSQDEDQIFSANALFGKPSDERKDRRFDAMNRFLMQRCQRDDTKTKTYGKQELQGQQDLSPLMVVNMPGDWIGIPDTNPILGPQEGHLPCKRCKNGPSVRHLAALIIQASAETSTSLGPPAFKAMDRPFRLTPPGWVLCLESQLTPEQVRLFRLCSDMPPDIEDTFVETSYTCLATNDEQMDAWLKSCGFTGNPNTVFNKTTKRIERVPKEKMYAIPKEWLESSDDDDKDDSTLSSSDDNDDFWLCKSPDF